MTWVFVAPRGCEMWSSGVRCVGGCRAGSTGHAGRDAGGERLCRAEIDGRVMISVGARVVFEYAADDAGLRSLAAVTLPELGFAARQVAEVVGVSEE